MGGYHDYTYGSKRLGAPEESYLYSSSSDMSPKTNYDIGGAEMATSMQPKTEEAIMGGATTGALAGGPAGAAIGAGGAFLTNYMAQRAADERAKRDRAAQIENQYAQNQNQGFDTMMRTFQGALR